VAPEPELCDVAQGSLSWFLRQGLRHKTRFPAQDLFQKFGKFAAIALPRVLLRGLSPFIVDSVAIEEKRLSHYTWSLKREPISMGGVISMFFSSNVSCTICADWSLCVGATPRKHGTYSIT
jgi:hypothetical protein